MATDRSPRTPWVASGFGGRMLAVLLFSSLLFPHFFASAHASSLPEETPPQADQLSMDGQLPGLGKEGRIHYYYLLGQILLRERQWEEAEKALVRVAEADEGSTESRTLIAHLATQRGDLKQAIRYSREVVEREPENTKARHLLAGLLAATNEHAEAAGHYEALIQTDAGNAPARLMLAQIYGRLKQPKKARRILMPLFDKKRDAWRAYLALGRAYVHVPDLEKAVAPFRKALKLAPDQLEPVLALGTTLQELKRVKEAEKVYRDYLNSHPDEETVHNRLGRLFLDQNNRKAALDQFQIITRLVPDSVQARLTTALILMSQAEYEEALKELRLAEGTDPDNGSIHYYLGQALEALDRDKEAEVAYRKVSSEESFHAQAQVRLAYIEAVQGRRSDGIRRVRGLLEKDPDNLGFLVALNVLLLPDEDYEGVVETATKGLAIDPGHSRLRFNRAMALDKLKRWPEAEKDLQLYLRENPEDAHALNYLGYSWADRNEKLDDALKLLEKATRLSPGDGFITDSLGWVYYRLNRLDEALKRMREAVRLEPNDATIQEHLGDVLKAKGMIKEALAVWEGALKLDEKNEALRKKIQEHAPKP